MSFFKGIDILDRGLEASWTKNSVILNNIANVDTPNFKASEFKFEQYFRNAYEKEEFPDKRTRDTHMKLSLGNDGFDGVIVDTDTVERMDGNNVDINRETTEYSKNYIYYNTLLRKINGQFSQLQTAITGQ